MSEEKNLGFYEVSSLLNQLEINLSESEVKKKIGNFDFNTIRDKGELMLAKKAFEGEVNAVKFLLENGANPNLESWSYDYYKGPAIYLLYKIIVPKLKLK